MENLSLMDRFKDPALFEQMTSGEKLQGSLITTLLGMGLTFIVLMLLWALIAIMAKALSKETGSTVSEVVSAPLVAATASTGNADPMADEQLVAVIMAAIAASQGSGFKNNLVVRKINRISGNIPPWKGAGNNEAVDSRRM